MKNSSDITKNRVFVIGSNNERELFFNWILSDPKLIENLILIIDNSVSLRPNEENLLKKAQIEFQKFNFTPRKGLNYQYRNRLFCQNLHKIIDREFDKVNELMCFSSSPALLDYSLSGENSRIFSLSVFVDCMGFSKLVSSYIGEGLDRFDGQNELYLESHYLNNVDKIYLPDIKSYWFYAKSTQADVYVSNHHSTFSNDHSSIEPENISDLDSSIIKDVLILDWDTNPNFLAVLMNSSILHDKQRFLIWDPKGNSAKLNSMSLRNSNIIIIKSFNDLDLRKVTVVLNQLPSENDYMIPFLKRSGARFKYFWSGLGSLSSPECFDIHLTKNNLESLRSNSKFFKKYESTYCKPVGSTKPCDGLVSICIPHFNRSDRVRRSLYSAIGQTYENIEIIISDDGSSVEHLTVVENLVDQAQRDNPDIIIKLIRSKNSYLGASRNRLVNAARGEFVFFLDDDNVAHPRLVEACMSNSGFRSSDVVSVIQARGPDSQSESFFDYFFGEIDRNECTMEDFFNSQSIDDCDVTPHFPTSGLRAFARNTICDGNCFVRKHVWHQLRGNSEVYGIGKEDYEFFARAIEKGYRFTQMSSPMIHTTLSVDTMKKLNSLNQFALFRVHFGVFWDRERIDYSDLYQRLIVSFAMQDKIQAPYMKNFLSRNIYLLLNRCIGGTMIYFILRRMYFNWLKRAA